MRTESVDFSHIPARHDEINIRLEHWALWVKVRPQAWKTQPMFRQYRSHAWQWHRPELKIELNTLECHEIEKQVSQLPSPHRDSLRWFYVYSGNPRGAARSLGLTLEGLLDTVNKARDMLKNRLRTSPIWCTMSES